MSSLNTLKDHFKESQLYLNRTVAMTILVLIGFFGLICRLVFLQIFHHEHYRTLSLKNQVRILPIIPARGLIYDRNGTLLAENVPAFNLEIYPEQTDDLKNTVNDLDSIFSLTEAEKSNFFKQLRYKRFNEGIPIRSNLTEEEVAKFSIEKHRLSGVDIVAHLIRHYPKGDILSHALGYIGPVSEKDLEQLEFTRYPSAYYLGKTGLEKFYEKELRGQLGYQHVETDAKGRMVRVLKRIPPVAGSSLRLSLDSELQRVAFNALDEHKGSVIVMDPNTGEVLALVSKPGFDPNLFVQGIDSETYQALRTSPDRPLFNRAIQGQYPPGSTVKPLVALQGLELGAVTTQFTLFDPGWYQLNANGRLFRDWIYHSRRHGHGWVNLERALTESCDTYFFNLAHKLGIRHLQAIYKQFGLGERTRIDIVGEMAGNVPTPEWKKRVRKEEWYAGDTLNIGIGQGMLLATPIQMAQMAAILARRGQSYTPHLLQKLEQPDGVEQVMPNKETAGVALKQAEHWNFVISGMRKVVQDPGGTAYRAYEGARYQVAGKTGTSQVFNLKQNEKYETSKVKEHLRDHSLFIGFSPIENPEVAIVVLVENKNKKTAAMVAKTVLDSYFKVAPSKSPVSSSTSTPAIKNSNDATTEASLENADTTAVTNTTESSAASLDHEGHQHSETHGHEDVLFSEE